MKYGQPKPRPIDDRWRERLPLAIRVLREIQDAWLRSTTPFPTDKMAAVLIRIFGLDFYIAGDLWRRTAAEWISAASDDLDAECRALCPAAGSAASAEVVASLRETLGRAAESWERRSPAMPSCEDVVNEVLQLLVARGFVQL
jgi:hypothetical protein